MLSIAQLPLQTEASLSRRSDTIRLEASLALPDAAGEDSNRIAAGGALIALTPFTMTGVATYGINAATATTKIKVTMAVVPPGVGDVEVKQSAATRQGRVFDSRSGDSDAEGCCLYQFGPRL
jgi:hypothetical protein